MYSINPNSITCINSSQNLMIIVPSHLESFDKPFNKNTYILLIGSWKTLKWLLRLLSRGGAVSDRRCATVVSPLQPMMTCQQQTWQPAVTTGKVNNDITSHLNQLLCMSYIVLS